MKSKARKNNKNLKIVAATGLTIFSLFSVFIATMAWFSSNIDTSNNGMNIDIGDIGGRLRNVYFHSFDSYVAETKDGSGNVLTPAYFNFVKTPFITYDYNWATGELETVETEDDESTSQWIMGDYYYDDRNHPLLVIFAFDKDYASTTAGDIYVRGVTTVGGTIQYAYDEENDPNHTTPLYTTNGGFLGARDEDGAPLYELNPDQALVNDENNPERILFRRVVVGVDDQERPINHDYYALSSVVDFQYRTFTYNTYDTFLSQNAGNTLDFAVNTLSDGESFTTINTETDRYLFNQTPYFYKSTGSETVMYIALVINYSPEAIGYIYSTYLGDSGLDAYYGTLRFDCDWRFEVV